MFQSKVIGCATVASFAGLTREGAEGVGGGAAGAVMVKTAPMEKFSKAQISADVFAETDVVLTGKLTLVAP